MKCPDDVFQADFDRMVATYGEPVSHSRIAIDYGILPGHRDFTCWDVDGRKGDQILVSLPCRFDPHKC